MPQTSSGVFLKVWIVRDTIDVAQSLGHERQRARALVYGEGRRFIYSLLPSRDLAGLRAVMQSTTALQ